MNNMKFHHISLVSKNLDAAAAFYCNVLGLAEVERPAFPIAGRWLRVGTVEVHLIDRSDGTFRVSATVDYNDIHFALRVPDFEAAISHFKKCGYHESETKGEEKRLRINRSGKAGYPQVFLMDPDNHIIEVNAAQL